MSQNLLVELFVEELPPKALKKLGEAFAGALFDSLKAQGLTTENSVLTSYATPRRLAAHITAVASKAADKQVAQKLMPATVGLDANGKATPALVKKLQSLGVDISADESAVAKLRKENDGKADVLFLDATQAGATLQAGLQSALDAAIGALPIPKVMTYQLADGWESVNFVRPAHGLVALHGDKIVPVTALGLASGNATQGHRFEAKNPIITLKNADSYAQQLKDEGAVIASFADRRAEIVHQLNTAATKENLKPIEDEALLDEVTALVERPNVLTGQFEKEFLEVPQECLILTMKANQKYFPLLDANGKLTNKFLIVSNINPADPSAVIGGNERVVRPRLADAKFFFDQDRKKTLLNTYKGLEKVIYHNKLGNQFDRNVRVTEITRMIARLIGDSDFVQSCYQAACYTKVDLLTDMVGEFPELQGIMGRYYIQNEGLLGDEIAFAVEDHYRPRFAGDALPRSNVGLVVALADKLETLVGLFSIGEKPTGDKDPFGLRRQALGILRIIGALDKTLNLKSLINDAFEISLNLLKIPLAHGNSEDIKNEIKSFCVDRLHANLLECGYNAQETNSVLEINSDLIKDIEPRLVAVRAFAALPEAPALAAANKRVGNILKKAESEEKAEVNTNLLQEPAEIALNDALGKVKQQADKLFESGDYTASLQALAALKAPVDDFFDNVMVNADDPALKANRLGLLAILHQTMNRVADLSKLAS